MGLRILVFRDAGRRRKTKKPSMLLKRARLAEAKLRGILASHEDQSKALVQAQQEGKSAACLMDVHKPQVRSAQRA